MKLVRVSPSTASFDNLNLGEIQTKVCLRMNSIPSKPVTAEMSRLISNTGLWARQWALWRPAEAWL